MIVASTIVPLTDLDALGGEMAVDPPEGPLLERVVLEPMAGLQEGDVIGHWLRLQGRYRQSDP